MPVSPSPHGGGNGGCDEQASLHARGRASDEQAGPQAVAAGSIVTAAEEEEELQAGARPPPAQGDDPKAGKRVFIDRQIRPLVVFCARKTGANQRSTGQLSARDVGAHFGSLFDVMDCVLPGGYGGISAVGSALPPSFVWYNVTRFQTSKTWHLKWIMPPEVFAGPCRRWSKATPHRLAVSESLEAGGEQLPEHESPMVVAPPGRDAVRPALPLDNDKRPIDVFAELDKDESNGRLAKWLKECFEKDSCGDALCRLARGVADAGGAVLDGDGAAASGAVDSLHEFTINVQGVTVNAEIVGPRRVEGVTFSPMVLLYLHGPPPALVEAAESSGDTDDGGAAAGGAVDGAAARVTAGARLRDTLLGLEDKLQELVDASATSDKFFSIGFLPATTAAAAATGAAVDLTRGRCRQGGGDGGSNRDSSGAVVHGAFRFDAAHHLWVGARLGEEFFCELAAHPRCRRFQKYERHSWAKYVQQQRSGGAAEAHDWRHRGGRGNAASSNWCPPRYTAATAAHAGRGDRSGGGGGGGNGGDGGGGGNGSAASSASVRSTSGKYVPPHLRRQ